MGGIQLFALLKPACQVRIPQPARTEALVRQLVEASRRDRPSDWVRADGILRWLIAPFLAALDEEELRRSLALAARFQPLLQHIERHLPQRISLRDLGRIAHLHPTYLSNAFTRMLGISPVQYVNRRRMERACTLLWDGDSSLGQVAEQLGFSDAFHFSKTFKKHIGIAPSHYRAIRLRKPASSGRLLTEAELDQPRYRRARDRLAEPGSTLNS